MGRELRRVPAKFNWPLGKTWDGFVIPESLLPAQCPVCDGQGVNPESRDLWESFYDTVNFGVTWTYEYNVDLDGKLASRPPWRILGNCRAWCHSITQDEVQALLDRGRLMEFTHERKADGSWERRYDRYVPTADEVNRWSLYSPMGHDGINMSILYQTRLKRLGIYGKCPSCRGQKVLFRNRKHKKAYKLWKQTPIPTGPWYQVWETVSAGSPVTPAFADPEDLISFLGMCGDLFDNRQGRPGWGMGRAREFVLESGWAPSGVFVLSH